MRRKTNSLTRQEKACSAARCRSGREKNSWDYGGIGSPKNLLGGRRGGSRKVSAYVIWRFIPNERREKCDFELEMRFVAKKKCEFFFRRVKKRFGNLRAIGGTGLRRKWGPHCHGGIIPSVVLGARYRGGVDGRFSHATFFAEFVCH
jgi:hypothetical protein